MIIESLDFRSSLINQRISGQLTHVYDHFKLNMKKELQFTDTIQLKNEISSIIKELLQILLTLQIMLEIDPYEILYTSCWRKQNQIIRQQTLTFMTSSLSTLLNQIEQMKQG
ncbi:unnamed protein product [Paramecium octaurelia]|uniref:Uncharacterized protein n=1 Tax=Paramecium octaurelia TaxID=43137 RepID=A0A8S1U4V7_PAROT|nr:unnamed protein product [Paramecium octaurelia]